MYARRFLDIKNAKNTQEHKNSSERNGRVTKGCKSGNTTREVIFNCTEGRVVRK